MSFGGFWSSTGRQSVEREESMDMREGEVILKESGKYQICCHSWLSTGSAERGDQVQKRERDDFAGSEFQFLLYSQHKCFGFRKTDFVCRKRGQKRG